MKPSPPLIAALLGVSLALPACAQQTQSSPQGGSIPGMQGHTMPGMQGHSMQGMQNMGPAHQEFMASMDKMHQGMMQAMMDPDPGKSWMKQMIAHHQGAVEMSEIVLKHSKDSEVIKEARKTKEQNQKDMRMLQAKLGKM